MTETPERPVSQFIIEFSGPDGLSFKVPAMFLTPAQLALAAQIANLLSQSILSQMVAQSQAAGLVRAPAGALGGLNMAGHLAKGGGRRA